MKRWNRNRRLAALVAGAGAAMGGLGGCIAMDMTAEKAFRSKLEKNRATLLASVGTMSITVFPAAVRGTTMTYDDHAAARLTESLNAAGLADATASDGHVPITGPWRMNQSRMWRDSAKEFGEYVRANPIGTRYALLPEYLDGKTEVIGIHTYIVDAEGAVAFVVLLNSHWEEFSKVNPKTEGDCTAVLIDVLRDRLKPQASQKP
ncbi:MAG: hypothetical protein HOP29_09355 [Phycisphaerales bacterium]|nr:hypothetical protein [Phycisphaerales bacterium]